MSVIDEVKQKTDITEIIGQYIKLTKAGRNFRGLCPFHGEKNPSFFVYPEQQSWHCFGCNTGGDAFSFLMKKEDIDFPEALRLLAEKAGVVIPSRYPDEDKKEEKDRLFQINETAARYFHDLLLNSPGGQRARDYIASRGFSPESVNAFRLGFSLDSWESLKQYLLEREYTDEEMLEAGLIIKTDDGRTHDRFRGRLMFPINDERGRTTGFGARALDDTMPKYLNSAQSPIFDKSGTLYGIDKAAKMIRQHDQAIIVEGYVDAITAHQNGISNVVACMGIAITDKQVTKIKRLTRNLVLALDADAAGEEAMLRGITYENILESEIRVAVLTEGKDPDDVIKEDASKWRQFIDDAMPIVDYAFNMAAAGLDMNTARDKAMAADKLLPIVASIKNPIRRGHYAQRLARLIKSSERDIEDALRSWKTAAGVTPPRYTTNQYTTKKAVPVKSAMLEDFCLSLLLKHPELKKSSAELLPEYLQRSENRTIYHLWQQTTDTASLRETIDPALREHYDELLNNRKLSLNTKDKLNERYADSVSNLREKYIRELEAKREDIFQVEAETGGAGADLTKLLETGMEPSILLKELHTRKDRRRHESRR